ncbi:hypothetical protein NH288_04970 [Anaerococcus sp. NML200537]|uniref:hypothetical protein n=1 Tax=Anaerococcus sp. NML200537 TaxID=2954485 RepID=UPI00223724C7|nr:hypothetical protein [Anaerococcus sp. NML200537]MCW6701435.1 hypothetical protein [Anaerococcus sp. NML200537]
MKITVDFKFGGKEDFDCDDYSTDYDKGILEIKANSDVIGMIMLETIKYWKVEDKQE